MRVLVTGGHGFIGSHLCAGLVRRGCQVRVLARPGSDLRALDGLKLEVALGDLGNPGSLVPVLAGVARVAHLAGALTGFGPAELMAVNRDGTRNLLAACPRDLERFVLVSSLAAAGPGPGPGPRPATLPEAPITWYGQSKAAAEAEVTGSGLPAVIVRPPVVFGPRDRALLPYFRLARRGLLPVPDGRDRYYSLVFAPDLAEALMLALEVPGPPPGPLPLVNPAPVTWADFACAISQALGRRGRILRVPEPVLRLAGQVAGLVARVQGRPAMFSPQKVMEMLAPAWVADPEPARRGLGWSAATPLDQALARTVQWYRAHGWL